MKKIVILLAAAAIIISCQKKEEPKPLYEFPAAPLQAQDDIKIIQEAVRIAPDNVNAWIKLGNTLMDSRRFNEAIDAYGKALELDPKNVDVRVDMGICYRNTGRPDIAVNEFKKALDINPAHLFAHKNLAVVLAYDLHDNAGAVREYEQYLRLAPYAPDADQVKREIEALKTAK